MSVTVRRYKRGGWEVDIRTVLADGMALRKRWKAPVSSKSGAKRWGEHRERELILEKQANAAERAVRSKKGGADTGGVRTEVPGQLRASQPSEAEHGVL